MMMMMMTMMMIVSTSYYTEALCNIFIMQFTEKINSPREDMLLHSDVLS